MEKTSVPQSLSKDDVKKCESLLSKADMFMKVPPNDIKTLVQQMKMREMSENETLVDQGEVTDRFFLLESGDIRRTHVDLETGKAQVVEFAIKAQSINTMRILSQEKAFSTVKCVSGECKVYQMMRQDLIQTLEKKPHITLAICDSLARSLRHGSKKFATPLLEQKQQDVNIPAISIAAGIESYYRSALNAMLNARLTGVKADLFPNMHIQVPMRVAYITGFKGIRSALDKHVHPDKYDSPNAVRLAAAVLPGIIMTPISSMLEASNAGHMNAESMRTRWMRGIVPRGGREIIFGVGLNQLSDYFEERLQPVFPGNTMLANAAGSLAAGVVSGYLSHVPHNMSTFKLLEPHRSYGDLYKQFVDKSVPASVEKLVEAWPATPRGITRTIFATLYPKGVAIRTVQIVGSFMILNGTINYLQLKEHHKIQRALGVT